MSISENKFTIVKKFVLQKIRANKGRAIIEELRTPAFCHGHIYLTLKRLEKEGVVERTSVLYTTGDNTKKYRRAWRIVGEPFEVSGACCDVLKAPKTRTRKKALVRPTVLNVVDSLRQMGAVDKDSAVSALQLCVFLGKKNTASYIYYALFDATRLGLIDYITVMKDGRGYRRPTRVYFC